MLYDEDNAQYTIEVADGTDPSCGALVGKLVPVDPSAAADFGREKFRDVADLRAAIDWPGPVPDSPAMAVPLAGAGTLHGVLIVTRPAGRQLLEEDPIQLATFAGHAALALERVRAQEERELLAVLGDRERIARDLHDVVIQRLFATGMHLQTAARLAARPDVAERVNAAVDDLDTTIREIRSAIFELRTPMTSTLRSEVRALVGGAADALGVRPALEVAGPVDSAASPDIRADVLAVLRESLSNVVRHARASAVSVRVAVADGRFSVTVADNGVGISQDAARSGLENLRERATRHGGRFTMRNAEPTGTVVEWSIPL
jgi:signal transduction histidine kinase